MFVFLIKDCVSTCSSLRNSTNKALTFRIKLCRNEKERVKCYNMKGEGMKKQKKIKCYQFSHLVLFGRTSNKELEELAREFPEKTSIFLHMDIDRPKKNSSQVFGLPSHTTGKYSWRKRQPSDSAIPIVNMIRCPNRKLNSLLS